MSSTNTSLFPYLFALVSPLLKEAQDEVARLQSEIVSIESTQNERRQKAYEQALAHESAWAQSLERLQIASLERHADTFELLRGDDSLLEELWKSAKAQQELLSWQNHPHTSFEGLDLQIVSQGYVALSTIVAEELVA